MFNKYCPLTVLLVLCFNFLNGQITFPINGVNDERSGAFALTNATIQIDASTRVTNATLLIKGGVILGVGEGIDVPDGFVEMDRSDRFIYPSFIDMYCDYGLPKPESVGEKPTSQPQMLSNKPGAYHWNEALKTEYQASMDFQPNIKQATPYLEAGIGVVLTHKMDGISRGVSSLVALGKDRAHEMILKTIGGTPSFFF